MNDNSYKNQSMNFKGDVANSGIMGYSMEKIKTGKHSLSKVPTPEAIAAPAAEKKEYFERFDVSDDDVSPLTPESLATPSLDSMNNVTDSGDVDNNSITIKMELNRDVFFAWDEEKANLAGKEGLTVFELGQKDNGMYYLHMEGVDKAVRELEARAINGNRIDNKLKNERYVKLWQSNVEVNLARYGDNGMHLKRVRLAHCQWMEFLYLTNIGSYRRSFKCLLPQIQNEWVGDQDANAPVLLYFVGEKESDVLKICNDMKELKAGFLALTHIRQFKRLCNECNVICNKLEKQKEELKKLRIQQLKQQKMERLREEQAKKLAQQQQREEEDRLNRIKKRQEEEKERQKSMIENQANFKYGSKSDFGDSGCACSGQKIVKQGIFEQLDSEGFFQDFECDYQLQLQYSQTQSRNYVLQYSANNRRDFALGESQLETKLKEMKLAMQQPGKKADHTFQ